MDDIKEMIASSQLELALRHTLTLVQGTAFLKKVEELAEGYIQLYKFRRLQVIHHEEANMEENRIAFVLTEILGTSQQAPEKKETNSWGGIKKWFQ